MRSDRLEPAVILAERGALDYLALECLAERTIALAQLRKRRNPAEGYDPLLKRRVEMLLPVLKRRGVRLISNFGAANPLGQHFRIRDGSLPSNPVEIVGIVKDAKYG